MNSNHTGNRDLMIEILPEETENLPSGKYFYSVKMVYNKDGEDKVATIIPQTMFLLKEWHKQYGLLIRWVTRNCLWP